jgi:hypothetical protein
MSKQTEKQNIEKMPLIYLEWEDAISNSAWHTKKEVEDWAKDDKCIIREVGWLYQENKTHIVLVSRMSIDIISKVGEEESYGLLQKIPKTWIRKRINLKIRYDNTK